jgi:protein gp37
MNNVKKRIGWCDWTINPVKGLCPVGCSYCYARRAYGRNCNEVFKDKSIRYNGSVFIDLYKSKQGDRVFVGSTIDLFHPLCSAWNDEIISICRRTPELTFIFLTKCPEYLPKEWPNNCWVGVSATNFNMWANAGIYLRDVKAKVKFISFEPLQSSILKPDKPYGPYLPDMFARDLKFIGINWVIIGQQTPVSQKTTPRIEWVKEIVNASDKSSSKVFLKNNLLPLITSKVESACREQFYYTNTFTGDYDKLRQEIPVVK